MKTLRAIEIDRQSTRYFLILPIALMLLTNASIIYAQNTPTDSIIFYSASSLDSMLNAKISPHRVSRLLGTSSDGSPYLIITRDKPGNVEIHELYDDVAIIRSGRGVLKTGYEISGQKEIGKEPEREWVGGVIRNAKERNVLPGDFIVIPAMLPHQYIPKDGETLTYWTIKVKASKSVNR